MRKALLLLSLFAVPIPAQERVREPFLRLRIDGREALAANPQWTRAWSAVQRGLAMHEPGAAALLGQVEQLCQRLLLPVQVFAVLEPGNRFSVGMLSPAQQPDLLPELRRLELIDVPANAAVSGGSGFAQVQLEGDMRLLEGRIGGDHLLLFAAHAAAPSVCVERFLAAIKTDSPSTRRLQAHLQGRGIELALNLEVLLGALPAEAKPALGVAKLLLGPRFCGFSARLLPGPEHLVSEVWCDIAPGSGLLGGLIPDEDEAGPLLGWVPREAAEFTAVRLSIDGVATALRQASAFGLSLDPADWDQAFEALRGTDLADLVSNHLTGSFAFLGVPTTAAEALDPEAPIPMVVLLGSDDTGQALQALRGLLARFDGGFTLVDDAAFGEGVSALRVGSEVIGRVAVRPGLLAVADVDPQSSAILRSVLATGGKGSLPENCTRRLGKADGTPTLVSFSHLLSNIQSRAILHDMTGRRGSLAAGQQFVDLLAKEFAGDAGMVATRMTANRDGLSVRTVW